MNIQESISRSLFEPIYTKHLTFMQSLRLNDKRLYNKHFKIVYPSSL